MQQGAGLDPLRATTRNEPFTTSRLKVQGAADEICSLAGVSRGDNLREVLQSHAVDGSEETRHPLTALGRGGDTVFTIGENVKRQPPFVIQPPEPVGELQVLHQM